MGYYGLPGHEFFHHEYSQTPLRLWLGLVFYRSPIVMNLFLMELSLKIIFILISVSGLFYISTLR